MLAWHYTHGGLFDRIMEMDTPTLLPTANLTGPGERPVLWFSTHPHWEPSVRKMIDTGNGMIRALSMEEMRREFGLVRFGVETGRLVQWPMIGIFAKTSKRMMKVQIKSSRKLGADPALWYGTFEAIPVSETVMEYMNADREWVSSTADPEPPSASEQSEHQVRAQWACDAINEWPNFVVANGENLATITGWNGKKAAALFTAEQHASSYATEFCEDMVAVPVDEPGELLAVLEGASIDGAVVDPGANGSNLMIPVSEFDESEEEDSGF